MIVLLKMRSFVVYKVFIVSLSGYSLKNQEFLDGAELYSCMDEPERDACSLRLWAFDDKIIKMDFSAGSIVRAGNQSNIPGCVL